MKFQVTCEARNALDQSRTLVRSIRASSNYLTRSNIRRIVDLKGMSSVGVDQATGRFSGI